MRLFAIPNGGKRNVIEAMNLKRQGVLSGAWDLLLTIPKKGHSGLFIEMKVGYNQLTVNQVEFQDANAMDYAFEVCYTFEEFVKAIKEYLGE